MAGQKIDELVSNEALSQLDSLVDKLRITKDAMGEAIGVAIKYNETIGTTKTLNDFTTASEKASEALNNVKEAQQQVSETQAQVKRQTDAITESVKNKAIADADASKILTQLNGTTEENIKLLISQKAELANVNNQLKEHQKAYASSAKSISDHNAKTAQLTKRQIELKESTAQLNLLIRQQTKEQLAAVTSNASLTAQLNQARTAYNNMSAAERESSVQGKELLQTIEMLSLATKENNEAQGKYNDNVGNYKSALDGATEKQGLFGRAIERVTNLQYIGARAVTQFARGIIGLGVGFLSMEIGAKAIQGLITWISNLDVFTGRLNQAVQNLAAFNEVQKDAGKIAGENLGKLQVLKDTVNDVTLSDKERLKAAIELKKLWPEQLKNSSALAIANGEEKKSIDDLTESIVKQAKAEAALNKIKKLAGDDLELQIQSDKINYAKTNQLKKAKPNFENALQYEAQNYGKPKLNQEQLDAAFDASTGAQIKNQADQAQKDIVEKRKIIAGQIKSLEDYANKDELVKRMETDDKVKKVKDKTNQEDAENARAKLEREKQTAKLILDDETKSYQARLLALKEFIDKSNKLIDLELKAKNSIPGISAKKKDTNNVQADTQRLQLDAESKNGYEKLNKEFSDKIKSDLEEALRYQKDVSDKAIDIARQQTDADILVFEDEKSKKENLLSQQLQSGKIKEKQYRDELLALEDEYNVKRLAKLLQFEQAKLAILQAKENNDVNFAIGNGASSAQIADIKDKSGVAVQTNVVARAQLDLNKGLDKQAIDGTKSNTEKKIEHEKALQIVQQEALKTATAASNLIQAEYAKEIAALERKAQLISDTAELEKSRIEAGVGNNREKALKIQQIEKAAASQRAAIVQQENQIKRKAAIADRAGAVAGIIANTAEGATKVVSQTGVFGIPLVPVVLALGAAQLAATLATPIPAFEKGGVVGADGPILTGEKGAELRLDPSGQLSLTDSKPNITMAKKGTQIISHDELIKMMAKPNLINYVGGQAIDLSKVVDGLGEIKKEIKNQNAPRVRVGINKSSGWDTYRQSKGIN